MAHCNRRARYVALGLDLGALQTAERRLNQVVVGYEHGIWLSGSVLSGSSGRASDTDKTAKILYEAKWMPFFKQIDKKFCKS